MHKRTMARLFGALAAVFIAWLSGPGTALVAHADTDLVGTWQIVNEGGVAMKVETPAIGAPPAPSEYLIYAQRPGVVFPATVGGCTLYSQTSYYCPPVNNLLNKVPCYSSGCINSSPSTTTCTDGCEYCWQQGYKSCTDRDPTEEECAGNGQSNPAYTKALWSSYYNTYVEVWLQWSEGCQSNWSTGQMDNDNGIDVAMGYGAQPAWDQGYAANYDGYTVAGSGQGGNQAYSDMLWGGAGSNCTTALAEYMGGSDTEWRHTRCVGN
jgi:hypothetical protein